MQMIKIKKQSLMCELSNTLKNSLWHIYIYKELYTSVKIFTALNIYDKRGTSGLYASVKTQTAMQRNFSNNATTLMCIGK